MKRVISIATAGALALAALTVSATAQDFNLHERTFLTFSNQVELPGTRLEPGTYVFRLADTPNRNIVQVLTEDEQEMLGQWIFIQAQRDEPSEETVITFRETEAGSMPAVQYWYYPGETIGKEFIYPKDQAMQIAQRTGATVMTEEGRINAQGVVVEEGERAEAEIQVDDDSAVESGLEAAGDAVATGVDATADAVETGADATADLVESGVDASLDIAETEPAGDVTAAETRAEVSVSEQPVGTSGAISAEADVRAEDQAVGTTGAADAQAQPSPMPQRQESPMPQPQPQPQQQQQQQTYGQRELPRTASPLPVSGLIALLSLAGAAGIRKFRQ